jgi:3-oxoadipate enol-lactonase / 4-carboxymuconolactone decarboxylase
VGLSFGGGTGSTRAAPPPDRVDRLVLVATAAHLAPPEAWRERARTVREQGMGAIVDAVLGRWFTPAVAAERVGPVRATFLATDPEGYAACCEAIAAMDLREAIGAIRAPTLVVAGADDPATPPALAEAIRARIPGAEMVVLPAAHLIAVERPEALAAHIAAFLERADPAPDVPRPAHPAGRAGPPGPASFPDGLANRKAVLGAGHVERSLARAGPFATPWQDFITRAAWGEVWGDPTLPWKTRSLVTLALMIALNREEEFKLHVRPALGNGVTLPELRALLHHAAIYAGVPAANGAFRWVREVLGDEVDGVG